MLGLLFSLQPCSTHQTASRGWGFRLTGHQRDDVQDAVELERLWSKQWVSERALALAHGVWRTSCVVG